MPRNTKSGTYLGEIGHLPIAYPLVAFDNLRATVAQALGTEIEVKYLSDRPKHLRDPYTEEFFDREAEYIHKALKEVLDRPVFMTDFSMKDEEQRTFIAGETVVERTATFTITEPRNRFGKKSPEESVLDKLNNPDFWIALKSNGDMERDLRDSNLRITHEGISYSHNPRTDAITKTYAENGQYASKVEYQITDENRMGQRTSRTKTREKIVAGIMQLQNGESNEAALNQLVGKAQDIIDGLAEKTGIEYGIRNKYWVRPHPVMSFPDIETPYIQLEPLQKRDEPLNQKVTFLVELDGTSTARSYSDGKIEGEHNIEGGIDGILDFLNNGLPSQADLLEGEKPALPKPLKEPEDDGGMIRAFGETSKDDSIGTVRTSGVSETPAVKTSSLAEPGAERG